MNWEELQTLFESSLPVLQNFLVSMVQPWKLYQLAIIAAAFLLAHVAAARLRPRLQARMREMDLTMRRARFLITLLKRLRVMLFCAIAWSVVLVLRQVTWPSRSQLIALAASLATAWVVVTITSRTASNKLLAQVIAVSAWTLVALGMLGWLPATVAFLDQAALDLGDTHLSLLLMLKTVLTLTVLVWLAALVSRLVERRLAGVEEMSPSMRVLVEKLSRIVLFALAVVVGLQTIGFNLTSLTVFSGAIGLGLGFGLQKVVSNLVSGFILLLDRSIKPGDVISLGETFGWITSLGARYVSVVTRDGREYLIPNEDLITGQVVNWTHSNDLVRLDVYFGVAYASDPHHVRRVAREAAAKVSRVVPDTPPVCHIVGFGDSSVDFILRFWIRDPNKGLTNVRGDVYLALWDAFAAEGIQIPFPQREVKILDSPPDRAAPGAVAD